MDAASIETKDIPHRCPHRCVHEVAHAGPHQVDDGTAKWAAKRAEWGTRALVLMERRAGKVGRPSKLSQEVTISEIAEWCGVTRKTLYEWWDKAHPEPESDDAEQDEHAEEEADAEAQAARKQAKAIKTVGRVAEWAGKAASPDTWTALLKNPEARTRAVGLARLAIEQLAKLITEAAPTLTPEERAALHNVVMPLEQTLAHAARPPQEVAANLAQIARFEAEKRRAQAVAPAEPPSPEPPPEPASDAVMGESGEADATGGIAKHYVNASTTNPI